MIVQITVLGSEMHRFYYVLHYFFRCIDERALSSDRTSCVNDCPDGSSEGLIRINDTTIFASICISQGDHCKTRNSK